MNQYSFRHNYFNTYYYSNIISNILDADFEVLGFIDSFFNDEHAIHHLARPFEKESALHAFIFHVIHNFFDEDMCSYDERNFQSSLYADIVLKQFGINDYSLEDVIGERKPLLYSDVEEYHDELRLSGTLEELFHKITNEVFYLLFNNRDVLLRYNRMVAQHMDFEYNKTIEDPDIRKYFNNTGFLRRVRIPEWIKRAVFFRDRGKCCLCLKDLSGLLTPATDCHYDHIVPLAQGGLNDVTNLQLLCSSCNLKKNKHYIATSDYYEAWY